MLPPAHPPTSDATDAVLLVSPDRALCRTFSRELARLERWWFLEAHSIADAYRVVSGRDPGALVVVDLGLDAQGDPDAVVNLVRMLRRHGWHHIVAVGDAAGPDAISDVLTAGAHAYLVVGDLLRIQLAEHQLPPTRRPPAGPRASAPPITGWDPELNPRGIEVIELVARGFTNRDIGRALGIGTETVKGHVARMSRRLGAHQRAHLVLIAMRSGIVE